MKTNQIMIRKMGSFNVKQRTSDGFFNATSLLKQWNGNSVSERKMDNYFNSDKTKEFISTIMERENLHTPKMVYVKSKASRGENAGTWMNPMLFIDFAMWINPSFKYDVLKFVYDEMIKYRNMAGDAYSKLASSVMSVVGSSNMPKYMPQISKAINYIVFNNHDHGERNKHGIEEKQKELCNLELKVADLIEDGFITNYDGIIDYLRKKWLKKYQPKLLQK